MKWGGGGNVVLCARSGRQRGYFNLAGDVTREAARPPHGSLNRKPVAGSAKEQTAPPQSCATWTMPNTRPRQSTSTITPLQRTPTDIEVVPSSLLHLI
ncbi:unnamed protein product, partial [Brenthis ino]